MNAEELNRPEIERHAARLLNLADARFVVPTPMHQLRRALELASPAELAEVAAEVPRSLLKRARQLGRRVRGFLAVRERLVYLDPDLRHHQERFVLGHELGHFMLPWQHDIYKLDDDLTLAPDVRDRFEREANFFGADLLFNLDELRLRSQAGPMSLTTPIELAGVFDASLIATTRRYVEDHPAPCALLVIGQHETRSLGRPGVRLLYGSESEAFRASYGPVLRGLRLPTAWPGDFHDLATAAHAAVRRAAPPLTRGDYTSVAGDAFKFEVTPTWPFPLVLLSPRRRREWIGRPRRVEWAAPAIA